MTTDDDEFAGEAEIDNPLVRQLDETQRTLLDLVALPLSPQGGPWPVWDFVARELDRALHRPVDAGAVWRSLPAVFVPGQPRPYGLVWRSASGGDVPSLDERVGLTIAGLAALSITRPQVALVAESLVQVIQWLGARATEVIPDPNAVVRTDQRMSEVQRFFPKTTTSRLLPPDLSDDHIFDVLQHEFANIHMNRGAGDGPLASLSPWLRPYSTVSSVDDYLAGVAAKYSLVRADAHHRPTDLPLVLDYVSYVFAGAEGWTTGRLIVIPDLQTAASVAAGATNESEFNDRMSDLTAVLKSMAVPKPTPEVTKARYGSENPGAINCLGLWLEIWLHSDALERAIRALDDVRAAITIRNGIQHPSPENRRKTAVALARLGIEEPVIDWGGAWDTVRSRVADAFDQLRREVAGGQRDSAEDTES